MEASYVGTEGDGEDGDSGVQVQEFEAVERELGVETAAVTGVNVGDGRIQEVDGLIRAREGTAHVGVAGTEAGALDLDRVTYGDGIR